MSSHKDRVERVPPLTAVTPRRAVPLLRRSVAPTASWVPDTWSDDALASGCARAATGPFRAVRRIGRGVAPTDSAIRQMRLMDEITAAIAGHQPLDSVLAMIRYAVDQFLPDGTACVIGVDRRTNRLRLLSGEPADKLKALIDNEKIGTEGGASAQAAANRRWSVFTDLTNERFGDRYQELIAALDVGAIWVAPLSASSGELLGTLTVMLRGPRGPVPLEEAWVKRLALHAQLALEIAAGAGVVVEQIRHDPATGMLNHASMFERINTLLRHGEDRFALLVIALDRFRLFSDRIGHVDSDRLIAKAASRIRHSVGERGLVAHLEGGEFAVLVHDRSQAHDVAESMLKIFGEPIDYEFGQLLLVPTVGIVDADLEASAETLFSDGIAALHEAGARGVGHVTRFDGSLRAKVLERIRLGSDLRRGVDDDELELHYQPIIDLSDGDCGIVEALVRWRHPERGLIGPDDFIPLAEESGLIVPLGKRVLELAIAQIKAWQERSLALRITVNVSPHQLAVPEFPAMLEALLEQHDVSAGALLIELTESDLMSGIDSFEDRLAHLRRCGISVLIDDFGTGLSSLARLYELPISGVKIDQSFIARLAGDDSAQTVVRAITDIATSSGCGVVAEGVEDALSAELVRRAGCDYAQGYHYGRPMAAEELGRWLEAGGQRATGSTNR